MNDFEKMDEELGVSSAVVERSVSGVIPTTEYRDKLVERYHGGARSLVERLRADGKVDSESLLIALIDELVKETDNLLGNHLIATENGELRDASVISYKRGELLEKVLKAVQSKSQMEREGGVDIDSPSMVVIFTYFMKKVKETFEKMAMPDEQRDIFFRMLGEATDSWKRELREEFETMKQR